MAVAPALMRRMPMEPTVNLALLNALHVRAHLIALPVWGLEF
jgi:hypothetical protein